MAGFDFGAPSIKAQCSTTVITSTSAQSTVTALPLNKNGRAPRAVRMVCPVGTAIVRFHATTLTGGAETAAGIGDIAVTANPDYFNTLGTPNFTCTIPTTNTATAVLNIAPIE